MLAKSHSQSGHAIFTENGRALCSRVDPTKEAQAWVEHHAQDIVSAQIVIVMGLGCGYHLAELLKRFPIKKILVLECNSELVERVQAAQGLALSGVEILSAETVEEMLKAPRLQKALSKIFYVAEYRAGTSQHHDFFDELKNYLLARERLGFQFHLRWREDLSEVLDLRAIFLTETYLLSIKDLVDSIQPDKRDTPQARVLQVLREFVK